MSITLELRSPGRPSHCALDDSTCTLRTRNRPPFCAVSVGSDCFEETLSLEIVRYGIYPMSVLEELGEHKQNSHTRNPSYPTFSAVSMISDLHLFFFHCGPKTIGFLSSLASLYPEPCSSIEFSTPRPEECSKTQCSSCHLPACSPLMPSCQPCNKPKHLCLACKAQHRQITVYNLTSWLIPQRTTLPTPHLMNNLLSSPIHLYMSPLPRKLFLSCL